MGSKEDEKNEAEGNQEYAKEEEGEQIQILQCRWDVPPILIVLPCRCSRVLFYPYQWPPSGTNPASRRLPKKGVVVLARATVE